MSNVELLGAKHIRVLAQKAGVTPSKKKGQNFVIDPNTTRRIVRLANINPGDIVVEIGPGLGSLTLGLLETDAHVLAVEIDFRLARQLSDTVEQYAPGRAQHLQIFTQDALLTDALPLAPTHLVANLPYNVAVPILLHFLDTFPSLSSALIMVQAEVGHRICASKGSKIYGVPSLKAAMYGSWKCVADIPRNVFWPVPNVDSVLVAFEAHSREISLVVRDIAFDLIDQAFRQRRKMLRQSCATFFGSSKHTQDAFEAAGIDPTLRAEQLGLEQYISLSEQAIKTGKFKI